MIIKNIHTEERLLSEEAYTVEVPVKIHERIRVSGYIRTSDEENKDAAIIIFDFGDYKIDAKTLRLHSLKESKVGVFSYLLTGKEFAIWTAEIFIPVQIKILKISFRTLKNKKEIFIEKEMNISKDYAFSRLYKELVKYN